MKRVALSQAAGADSGRGGVAVDEGPDGDRYDSLRHLALAMATVVLEEQERRPVPALNRFTLTALRAGLVLEPQLAPRVRRVVLRAVLFARALLRCPAALSKEP